MHGETMKNNEILLYVVLSTHLVQHRPNIILSTLFSNILSQRSSLNVSDHVSKLYNTTGEVRDQYTLILNRKLEDTRFCNE